MVLGRPPKNPSAILQVACPYCDMRTLGLRAQADTGRHTKASQMSAHRILNSCLQDPSKDAPVPSPTVSPPPVTDSNLTSGKRAAHRTEIASSRPRHGRIESRQSAVPEQIEAKKERYEKE